LVFILASSFKNSRSRGPRNALLVLAIAFAAATIAYACFWMVAVRLDQIPTVELGFDFPFQSGERASLVTRVRPKSPAELAGIQVGDKVLALDGFPLESAQVQRRVYLRHRPGDSIRLTIRRPGLPSPIILTGVFRQRPDEPDRLPWGSYARQLRDSLPVAFVVVGFLLLFLRLQDRNLWLLAIFFAGIIALSAFPNDFDVVPTFLRPGAVVYKGVFLGLFGGSFYFLCAVFPTQSIIDRRLPWLKWVAIGLGLAFAGEMNGPGVHRPVPVLSTVLGVKFVDQMWFDATLVFLALGLVSLASNYFRAAEPESRRRIRVIFWGTVVGMGPAVVVSGARQFAGFVTPYWLMTAMDAALLLIPAAFAYAVFKQRVLEIPVLLQRSARYLLVQRGFVFLLTVASIGLTLAFALSFQRMLQPVVEVDQPSGIAMGAVFGTALFWSGSQIHRRVSGKIDRAFFRNAYDARVILEDLANQSRTATDRSGLARLLECHLKAALRPSSLVVYLRQEDGALASASGDAPLELQTISSELPLLIELARRGQPWECPAACTDDSFQLSELAPLQPDCLAPMLERGGELAGVLVLGRRLSEEPYSSEDKRLLASVASQAGAALENMRLAAEISERLEAERRTAREMEIAKEVQGRLLPQAPPLLRTLDCAARCLQARSVGGDYYDFLELAAHDVGFVLADVSGKGVHAALLMATLQAHLRSQSGISPGDPVGLLKNVNRLLWKSTSPQHYATLFFGLYDDISRRLTYVNCGHNPPVLLRADGSIERLKATATVIGLFERWECGSREIALAPGDTLAIFSDGVTEAMRVEEEYGEERLLNVLLACRTHSAEQMVTAVFQSVQAFSAGEQSDDLTLLIARARVS
jgi:sigma-B regulation protein RsbU (phosphoserine phosphatase)